MSVNQLPERPRISGPVKGYRYPRTVAELIALRSAQLEARPEQLRVYSCPHGHGPQQPRPLGQQTYEQLYCGLWWDCKNGCTSSALVQSRDLAYDHGEPYHDGYGWEKFDGASWAPISDREAAQFRAQLKAWHAAREPKPRRKRLTAAHRHAQALTST